MNIDSELRYIQVAQKARELSDDPSTKVGACLASHQGIFAGYNKLLPGTPEEYWNDREKKYRFVEHAEAVVVRQALQRSGAEGGTLYVTAHPCKECAKLIVAAGVRCVVCPEEPWRDDPAVIATVAEAKEIFDTCGVQRRRLPHD